MDNSFFSVLTLRIDNSGCSVIRAIGRIPETIDAIITCAISNDSAYFSASLDMNNILIILRIRKLCI